MNITLDSFLNKARANPGRVVIPCAENHEALEALEMAVRDGIVQGGLLIGNVAKIRAVAAEVKLALDSFKLIECNDAMECARMAAASIARKEADFLIKGQLDTKIYMKAILDKEFGLVPPGNLLSHTAIMEIPGYHKLLIATDAAISIDPGVEEKLKITQNAVDLARKLGITKPKVALLAAAEKVNPKMLSTVHADECVRKAREGAIQNAIVEGPYDVYIATSKEGAEIKGVKGEVCGDADILVFPEINSANIFYKTIGQFVKGARVAGLIAGASAPIILPSRADPSITKRMSLVIAAALTLKN